MEGRRKDGIGVVERGRKEVRGWFVERGRGWRGGERKERSSWWGD